MTFDPSKPTHITRNRGAIEEIRCKLCGTVIQELVEHHSAGMAKTRKAVDGTVIRTVRLVIRPTTNYQEMTIRFEDGSGHVTHGCRSCLAKARTDNNVLKQLMVSDITDQLLNEGMDKDIHAKLTNRQAVGVE